MDQARTIRFITPASFFIASLFFGACLDNPEWLKVDEIELPKLVAIIAGTTGVLFPLGFIITGVFTMFLRGIFRLFNKTYQVSLSKEAWKKVWPALEMKPDVERNRAEKVHAGLVFDHHILEKDIHDVTVRLWNAFNIAAGSVAALILSFLFGCCFLNIRCTSEWLILTCLLSSLFFLIAVVTWKEHMGLINFEALRLNEKKSSNQKEKSGNDQSCQAGTNKLGSSSAAETT